MQAHCARKTASPRPPETRSVPVSIVTAVVYCTLRRRRLLLANDRIKHALFVSAALRSLFGHVALDLLFELFDIELTADCVPDDREHAEHSGDDATGEGALRLGSPASDKSAEVSPRKCRAAR